MAAGSIRAGFIGAGCIAHWHAEALKRVPGARLGGVYDLSATARAQFATARGVATFDSIETLLAADDIDVVHVLTPPHFELVRRALEARKHVFVEKPLTLSASEARLLSLLATERGVRLGVNHNFLMLPGYERFRAAIEGGDIGPIDSFRAHWRYPLPPLRSGPYNLWMLREPGNVLHEIGPHLFAFAADLFQTFDLRDVMLRYPIEIPGGVTHYQGWRIAGFSGNAAVTLDLSLVEGHDDRSIEARGLGALARFSVADDAFHIEKAPLQDIVLGPAAAQASIAAQAVRTAIVNAARQTTSLNALAPFGLSIARAARSFYESISADKLVDRRLSAGLAARVAEMIAAAVEIAGPKFKTKAKPARAAQQLLPTMLVIGGTGFIARALVGALAQKGHGVRVFSRGKTSVFEGEGRVKLVTGDLASRADLVDAMDGVDGVFHLARAEEKTWDGYLRNDVEPTRNIALACIEAGVRRLVNARTIDCYDASRSDRTITEETPFDPDFSSLNLYARAKTACEAALLDMADKDGLPLTIVRPGVVVGRGGPLQHWGIALWRGPTACQLWGRGDGVMLFVSVNDVAQGMMLAMSNPQAEGRSFNLVGEPLLSARDYLAELGAAHGVRIRARPTPLWSYYAVDLVKYWMKRVLAGRRELTAPSLRDWRSRGQLSRFDNAAAKNVLGWRPQADRDLFIQEVVADSGLFGVRPLRAGATLGAHSGLQNAATLTKSA